MGISWSSRLTKTAGMCCTSITRTGIRTARIVLSEKVLDTALRLRDTLVHELCHAATWLLTGVSNGGHGKHWKRWTFAAMQRFPELSYITVGHDYTISTKFVYKCQGCAYSIGRHTKSLDTIRKVCGVCRGTFELVQEQGSKIDQGPEKIQSRYGMGLQRIKPRFRMIVGYSNQ